MWWRLKNRKEDYNLGRRTVKENIKFLELYNPPYFRIFHPLEKIKMEKALDMLRSSEIIKELIRKKGYNPAEL